MLPEEFSTHGGAKRRFSGRKSVPSQNGDRTGQAALSHSRANSRVSACVDQGETRFTPIPIERSTKSPSRSGLGLSDLQHSAVAATGLEAKSSSRRIVGRQPRPKMACDLMNSAVLRLRLNGLDAPADAFLIGSRRLEIFTAL